MAEHTLKILRCSPIINIVIKGLPQLLNYNLQLFSIIKKIYLKTVMQMQLNVNLP